ncbi:tyrosine-type recombinase/integrase [Rhodococcus hoagii]|nr:tyrosine-type recombinase/integrase [Prescottella equi]
MAQFCQSADLADLIVMFAATGARIGEVLGIRWEDVDLKKRTVAITGKVIRVKGDGLVREDSTKTESGLRQLPLPGFAVEMLEKRLVDRSGPMYSRRRWGRSGTRTRCSGSGGKCGRRSIWSGSPRTRSARRSRRSSTTRG